jgi:hypothetical protein
MMRRLVRMRHQIAFILFGALVALLALYPIGVVDAATDVAATRVEVENFLVEPTATTPPETTVTSGPSGSIASTRATFEFASSEANSTFRCRLLPLESAPTNCTSPKTYRGLTATTEYTFRVWATDASGNTDASPATRTFTPSGTLAARLEPPTWRPEAKGQATRRRVINVKDFGATGNGTSDDTAAFERAMAQAARLGGAVYVPAPGNYRIFSVTPPSNTRLQVQAGATLKKYGGKNGALFEVRGPNDTTTRPGRLPTPAVPASPSWIHPRDRSTASTTIPSTASWRTSIPGIARMDGGSRKSTAAIICASSTSPPKAASHCDWRAFETTGPRSTTSSPMACVARTATTRST